MDTLHNRIKILQKQKKAVILAHTYQPGDVQDVADYVGDSYGLSVEARAARNAEIIIFAGVRFMAETAAILCPDKKVILPVENAGCPMADMITPQELQEYKTRYPDYLVMCYVNTTAEIKALSDVCCTSSNALKIARQIPADKGILFVPDKHLGSWIQEQTGHRMVMWDGFCPTHARITPEMVIAEKRKHPRACILMHPEAPKASRVYADAILSTGGMCSFVKTDPHMEYIVATETGILHTLRKQAPQKTYYPLNDSIVCPNMKMGTLESIYNALDGTGGVEVTVEQSISKKARYALEKMLTMSK